MQQDKTQKPRKRKARKALLRFVRRLRKICATLDTLDQWYQMVSEIHHLVQEHEQALPEEARERLERVTQITDTSLAGMKKACKLLQHELGEVIASLPGPILPTIVTVPLLSLAGTIAAVYIATAVIGTVPITIRNNGCAPLLPPSSAIIQMLEVFPGVDFPREEIPDGGEAVARVPAITVTIQTRGEMIVVRALGVAIQFPLPGTGYEVEFDGVPVDLIDFTIDLGEQKSHELLIVCE